MERKELTREAFDVPEGDDDALERARARLDEAIRAEKRARRRRRHVLLPAAASIVLGTAVAVILTVAAPLGGSSAAAQELAHLAKIASSADAPQVGPGEYFLVPSEELRLEGTTDLNTGAAFKVLSRLHVKTWIGSDGSSLRRIQVVSSRFASEADRRAWEAAGRPQVPQAGDRREETTGEGGMFWIDLEGLPEDPAQLLAALRSGSIVDDPPATRRCST